MLHNLYYSPNMPIKVITSRRMRLTERVAQLGRWQNVLASKKNRG
jgi:hypothetical protein